MGRVYKQFETQVKFRDWHINPGSSVHQITVRPILRILSGCGFFFGGVELKCPGVWGTARGEPRGAEPPEGLWFELK